MSNLGHYLSVASMCGLALFGCNRQPSSEHGIVESSLLAKGKDLPDLVGIDQLGKEQRLKSNVGRITLVYFYPKDGTPGCTKQACAFRDVWQRFEQAGVALYGVSRDDRASHEKFASEHKLPFPLIADAEGKWATAFGVPSTLGMSRRVSFLFDKFGKVAYVYDKVDPGIHADQVLRDVTSLQ
jgi:thioredoxin-dependent peroxiredoxin